MFNYNSFFRKLLLISLLALTAPLLASPSYPALISQVPYLEDTEQCRMLMSAYSEENADVMKLFDESVAAWKTSEALDLSLLLKAAAFAAVKHEGQVRKDTARTPYIIHPLGVARILFEEAGVRDTHILIAALLHDTLEDTETTAEEIEKFFGLSVRITVEELTNSPGLTSQENKQRQIDHAPHMCRDAQLVKLADRLYNMRDLRNPPPSWTEEDVERCLEWGQKLLAVLPGVCPPLELSLYEEIQSLKKAT